MFVSCFVVHCFVSWGGGGGGGGGGWLLCFVCLVVLWLFLTVPWVGLQCVNVVYFLIILTSFFKTSLAL